MSQSSDDLNSFHIWIAVNYITSNLAWIEFRSFDEFYNDNFAISILEITWSNWHLIFYSLNWNRPKWIEWSHLILRKLPVQFSILQCSIWPIKTKKCHFHFDYPQRCLFHDGEIRRSLIKNVKPRWAYSA